MRDNKWLNERLNNIWGLLFPELPKKNRVVIKFKGKWKNKFGHIKRLKNKDSEIAINSIFKDERIPEYLIDLTIAHELIHYMHGFNSPFKQQFKYPHQGGVVERELTKRGFGHLKTKEKEFIKKEWEKIYPDYVSPRSKRNSRIFFTFKTGKN